MKKNLIFIICLSAAILVSCTSVPEKETPKPLEVQDHSEPKAVIKSTAEYKSIYKSEYFLETEIKYPQFKDNELLSKTIENSVLNYYNGFASTAEQDWKELNEAMQFDSDNDIKTPPLGYCVTSDVFETNDWTSVLLTTWIFTGGAHGNYYLTSYNFNEKTKKLEYNVINATGYSYDYLSTESRKQIITQLENQGFDIDLDWINGGTEPQPGNFEIFTMHDNTVTIYFEPYVVAPYVCGTIEVELPSQSD